MKHLIFNILIIVGIGIMMFFLVVNFWNTYAAEELEGWLYENADQRAIISLFVTCTILTVKLVVIHRENHVEN